LVIGVLLILAVLLDGYRRVRKGRGRKVRLSLKPIPTGAEPEELTRGELPNGGARLTPRSDGRAGGLQEPTFDADWQTEFRSTAHDYQGVADLSDAELPDVDAVKSQFAAPVIKSSARKPVEDSVNTPTFSEVFEPLMEQSEPSGALESVKEPVKEPVREPVFEAESMAAASEPAPVPTGVKEVIVVNAVSKDPLGFNGEELLHILLTCDLRFGKMNIFHRYEKSNAKGAVQFSVANAVEPGTFDLNNMRNFRTPGICLFLQLPGPQDAQKALEYMVETAQCVARNLNGELRDENRSALTAQTVEHFRSRIREFDRKRMAKHA